MPRTIPAVRVRCLKYRSRLGRGSPFSHACRAVYSCRNPSSRSVKPGISAAPSAATMSSRRLASGLRMSGPPDGARRLLQGFPHGFHEMTDRLITAEVDGVQPEQDHLQLGQREQHIPGGLWGEKAHQVPGGCLGRYVDMGLAHSKVRRPGENGGLQLLGLRVRRVCRTSLSQVGENPGFQGPIETGDVVRRLGVREQKGHLRGHAAVPSCSTFRSASDGRRRRPGRSADRTG